MSSSCYSFMPLASSSSYLSLSSSSYRADGRSKESGEGRHESKSTVNRRRGCQEPRVCPSLQHNLILDAQNSFCTTRDMAVWLSGVGAKSHMAGGLHHHGLEPRTNTLRSEFSVLRSELAPTPPPCNALGASVLLDYSLCVHRCIS
jgi:hypothetical protein